MAGDDAFDEGLAEGFGRIALHHFAEGRRLGQWAVARGPHGMAAAAVGFNQFLARGDIIGTGQGTGNDEQEKA